MKKCYAFHEEKKVDPKSCIYHDESEDSSQCLFCDGNPKKYVEFNHGGSESMWDTFKE